MKLDDDVKMISAEVPILFAKAAELFIQELTIHSWLQTEESRRRTLQVCISKSFFLIKFLPSSVMMSQVLLQKMNFLIFLLILFRVKKQQKHIRERKQSVKCNIFLHYQHQLVWVIPFNCRVRSLFQYKFECYLCF